MIEHQHAHWSRLSATPHAVRCEAERRCQGMPMADEGQRVTSAQKLDSLAVIGIVASPAAWYVFNATAAVLVALVFAAACLTVWVQMRRSL